MTKDQEKLTVLEQGLRQALQAIDSQLERELQRTPSEREIHGVRKWAPIATRIEKLTSFFLNELGSDEAKLESLIIISQAATKALRMACEDLGGEGLGEVRKDYCLKAFEELLLDSKKGRDLTSDSIEFSQN